MSNFTGTGIGSYQGDLQKYIKNFIKGASETLEDQCDLLDDKYRKESHQNLYNRWIFIAAIIAAIPGIIIVISVVKTLFLAGFNWSEKLLTWMGQMA